jgi:hypothetical protein
MTFKIICNKCLCESVSLYGYKGMYEDGSDDEVKIVCNNCGNEERRNK